MNDGINDSELAIIDITISPVDYVPVVTITSPEVGTSFFTDAAQSFTATDVEDGDVSAGITWSSDIEGDLGDGQNVTLSAAEHEITASVTVTGQTGTASVVVQVLRTVEGDVTASTQAELDALENVGTITGDLHIDTLEASLDFSPLDTLERIDEDLEMRDNIALTRPLGY